MALANFWCKISKRYHNTKRIWKTTIVAFLQLWCCRKLSNCLTVSTQHALWCINRLLENKCVALQMIIHWVYCRYCTVYTEQGMRSHSWNPSKLSFFLMLQVCCWDERFWKSHKSIVPFWKCCISVHTEPTVNSFTVYIKANVDYSIYIIIILYWL